MVPAALPSSSCAQKAVKQPACSCPSAQEGSREGLWGLMLLFPTGLLGTPPADEPLPMFSLLGPGRGG